MRKSWQNYERLGLYYSICRQVKFALPGCRKVSNLSIHTFVDNKKLFDQHPVFDESKVRPQFSTNPTFENPLRNPTSD